jgi:hypothetical protein
LGAVRAVTFIEDTGVDGLDGFTAHWIYRREQAGILRKMGTDILRKWGTNDRGRSP